VTQPNNLLPDINLKNYINTLLICMVLLSTISYAQYGEQKKADHLFNTYSFANATESYKQLIKKNYNTEYNTRQLADCYAFMRNPDSAAVYYKNVVNQKNIPIAYYYNYAQALRGIEDYKGYRVWMRKFKKAGGFVNSDYLDRDKAILQVIFNAKQHYFLNPVSFNSEYSDFGAIENNGSMYFASARNRGTLTKHLYGWNNEPFLDIYSANANTSSIIDHQNKLKGDVNSRFHDGPLTISKDGKTMYFSRNNFNKQVLGKNQDGITNLKIYKASLIDGKWTNIEELPFNSNQFSNSHPALSRDETKLYFASNGPSSLGGTDIFYVDINSDGTYGEPKNVGDRVNTIKNERFPFMNNEGILFFASDGHPGLGLLDIFATVLDQNNQIVDVVNLGVPVNSSKDDFAFFMSPDGLKGYFASNRNGGVGSDDIYAYKRIPPLELQGIVTDSVGAPIANAAIRIFNIEDQQIAMVNTDSLGMYSINIDRNTDYEIQVTKAEFEEVRKMFTSKGLPDSKTKIIQDFILNKDKVVLPFTELYPIYFDFNKYNIRKESTQELDRIVGLLMDTYPNMVIKIESHTDSRGSNRYNKKLSKERALATYNYLIKNGVTPNRISSYEGFGEERLVNPCDGTISCTEAQHQLNRRTQFIILKME